MSFSRRSVLSALGAGAAGLLLERQILAAGVFADNIGTAGLLNLKLTARSEGSLHIAIAPVTALPQDNR